VDLIVPANPAPVKIDIKRTALIVVDVQNAFCSKGGLFDIIGRLEDDKIKKVIQIDKKVIEVCRQKGIHIVYLRMGYRPDLADAGGPECANYWKEGSLVSAREDPKVKDHYLTVGSWDWQVIDEIKPQPQDLLVNKNRFSGFPNTDLDIVLRTRNIKYLLFCGFFTNVCVESNVRDAFFHEYFPILISDACGNVGPQFTQMATIWNVEHVFGWVTGSQELIQAFK
jgi:ureidoacrylate peracid hydrolase